MLVWYGMIRHDTVWYGTLWYDNPNCLHVAMNDRDSLVSGDLNVKQKTNQLSLAVLL